MQTRKSESTVYPMDLDTTSSQTTIYKRENITAEERTGMDGNNVTMYVYNETVYTKEEYESLVIAQTRADTDYIAIMMGVEL